MSPRPANAPSIPELNAALTKARYVRGSWIGLLSAGVMTETQLFDEAATADGKPLRTLRLWQVVAAQRGESISTAKRLVETFLDHLSRQTRYGRPGHGQHGQRARPTHRAATVGWLIDPHVKGRRVRVWMAVLGTDRDVPPAATFPWGGVSG